MLDGSGTGAKITSWWSRLSITSIGRTGAAPSPASQLDASVSAPLELPLPPLKRAAPLERSQPPGGGRVKKRTEVRFFGEQSGELSSCDDAP